jgi:hypothetical protein
MKERGIVSWGIWDFSAWAGKIIFTTNGAGIKGLENKGLRQRFGALLSRGEKKF